MPSIVLHCPNCPQAYQMSDQQIAKYAGRTITCKKCKQSFSFDAAMDAAAQSAGQDNAAYEQPAAGAMGSANVNEAGYDPYAQPQEPAYNDANYYQEASPPPSPPPPPVPQRPAAAPQYAPPPPHMANPQAFYPSAGVVPPPPGHADRASANAFNFGDLFAFRRPALRPILPLVFWAGIAYFIFNGLRLLLSLLLVSSFNQSTYFNGYNHTRPQLMTHVTIEGLGDRLFSLNGFYTVADALFWLLLGPLFWRGFCELILAATRSTDPEPRA